MKVSSENILNDFAAFTKNLIEFKGPKLISFAFHLEQFDALSLINNLNEHFDDIFFFRTPNSRTTTIGINCAKEITSAKTNDFSLVIDNYKYWTENFISNYESINISSLPVICCTAKFDSVKSSKLWDDFESLRIYIPEFFISFQNDGVIGYYNFVIESKSIAINNSSCLSNFLEKLSGLNKNSIQTSNLKRSIQSTLNGNELEIWNDIVLKALSELNNNRVEKLVLSRAYSFNLDSAINWSSLLDELFKRFPDCYLFFIKKNNSIFFGSSPEMFLKVSGDIAEVESVAGSAARGEKSESDYELEKSLRTSEKNHQEHLFVSDFISDILIKYSNNVRIIEEKQIRKLDNIQHLITKISAELNSNENLFELIDSLFPTPAVCGVQKKSAMKLIRELESHDRGLYSGIIGLIDFKGNCELAVSIRSALVKENKVTAFAGAGLVKNSDPYEEFLETNLKLNTILSLFTDENKS
jgi:menaquinone-specific isochorismate synthase